MKFSKREILPFLTLLTSFTNAKFNVTTVYRMENRIGFLMCGHEGEIFAHVHSPGCKQDEVPLHLPGELLASCIAKLDGQIELESQTDKTLLTSGSTKFELVNVATGPAAPNFPDAYSWTVDAKSISDSIAVVEASHGTGPIYPNIEIVIGETGSISCAATTGLHLAVVDRGANGKKFQVDPITAAKLKRCVTLAPDLLVEAEAHSLWLKGNNYFARFNIILAAPLPAWREIIELSQGEACVEVESKALVDAVRRVANASRSQNTVVKIQNSILGLEIGLVGHDETVQASDTVAAQCVGDLRICVQASGLSSVLANVPGLIVLSQAKSNGPMVLKSKTNLEFTGLLAHNTKAA